MAALAEIATIVTHAPWTLSAAHRARYRDAGLGDDDLLQAVALAAYFGHLNRIADAVGVPLDYDVAVMPPHADPTTPPLAAAPTTITGTPAIELASRAATAAALPRWVDHVMEREASIPREVRRAIAGRVARLLGDGDGAASDAPLEPAIATLVDDVTLAPWRLGDASFATLRSAGADDATLFDLCAIATTAGVVSRLRVALVALGR
ncbi:MAG: hypothetical protein NT062_16715 [Proteobacteria bacterium]|nr:hypothetical protein [Pseudomonadota bacterium]